MTLERWQMEARELGRVRLGELLHRCTNPAVLRIEVLDRPRERKRKRSIEQLTLAEHVPSQCCVTAVDRGQAIDLLTDTIIAQAWPDG